MMKSESEVHQKLIGALNGQIEAVETNDEDYVHKNKETKFKIGDFVSCQNTNEIGGRMWRIGIVIGYNYLTEKYTIAIPYSSNCNDSLTAQGLNIGAFCETWREDCLEKYKG